MPPRSSTGSFYPPDPPARYQPRYPSPRTSGERVGATTLASVENYDRNGRKISTYAPSAYKDPRASVSGASGDPPRRLSLNTAPSRPYEPRYPPSVSHTPTSATRAPDNYDRGSYYPMPAATRRHERQSSSIDDPRRSRDFDDRRRDGDYEPPRRRRESLDQDTRRDPRYHLTGEKESRHDSRTTYDYGSRREPFDPYGDPRRPNRSDSLDVGSREPPKRLMLEYPDQPAKPARDAGPHAAMRGSNKTNGVSRSESVREARSRSPLELLTRGRAPSLEEDDGYGVAQRRRPNSEYYERGAALKSPTRGGFQEREEPIKAPRKHDPDIAKHGFGLRAPSADPPRDRDNNSDKSGMIPAGMLGHRERDARERDGDDSYDTKAARYRPEHESKRANELPEDHRSNNRRTDHDRKHEKPSMAPELATAAGGGVAALAAGDYASRRHDKDDDSDERRRRDRRKPKHDEDEDDDDPEKDPAPRHQPSHHVPSRSKDADRGSSKDLPGASLKNAAIIPSTGEEDYEARMAREMERMGISQPKAPPSSLKPPTQHQSQRDRSPSDERSPPRSSARAKYEPKGSRDVSREVSPANAGDAQALTSYKPPEVEPVTDEPYSEEPDEMPMSPGGKRVAIVEPPKEDKKPKGILKTRFDPFPQYEPEPRPGVRPHKDAPPIPGVPEDANKTRLPRSQLSTKVLTKYFERFDPYVDKTTGVDMVVVYRVLNADTIEKYIRKSKEERGNLNTPNEPSMQPLMSRLSPVLAHVLPLLIRQIR